MGHKRSNNGNSFNYAYLGISEIPTPSDKESMNRLLIYIVPRSLIAAIAAFGLLAVTGFGSQAFTIKSTPTTSLLNYSLASFATSNPPSDISPNPNFLNICNQSGNLDNSAACQNAALLAIDNARAQEGVGPMHLPANYDSLSLAEQMLVVVNLERQDRGLATFLGLTQALDSAAALGAAANSDPILNFQVSYASNWAGGLPSVLTADYEWMYNDGYGSANIDCTSPNSSGCWGHRENILNQFPTNTPGSAGLYFGAAGNLTSFQGSLSLAMVEAQYSPTNPTVFNWSTAAVPPVGALGIGFFGSTTGVTLNQPIVGMASTPDGKGYWLVASDGGIFTFGDAAYYGSTGAMTLNKPIVGMASTPDGKGYWLVASDGGIFTFGDAAYYGSTGAMTLNKPIVGMASTPDGKGYWLVASDGGIFTFGDAAYYGSEGSAPLNSPVIGIRSPQSGGGYWMYSAKGDVFPL